MAEIKYDTIIYPDSSFDYDFFPQQRKKGTECIPFSGSWTDYSEFYYCGTDAEYSWKGRTVTGEYAEKSKNRKPVYTLSGYAGSLWTAGKENAWL